MHQIKVYTFFRTKRNNTRTHLHTDNVMCRSMLRRQKKKMSQLTRQDEYFYGSSCVVRELQNLGLVINRKRYRLPFYIPADYMSSVFAPPPRPSRSFIIVGLPRVFIDRKMQSHARAHNAIPFQFIHVHRETLNLTSKRVTRKRRKIMIEKKNPGLKSMVCALCTYNFTGTSRDENSVHIICAFAQFTPYFP